MRIVVATTADDPFAPVFWQSYHAAGGAPPAAVFFLAPHRRGRNSRLLGGVLLFGFRDAIRMWRLERRVRQTVRRAPDRIFIGTQHFYHCATLNQGRGLASLAAENPDVLVSAGAPEIFKSAVLSIPRIGSLNVHNGRLPAYRGLFSTFWEALMGEPWGFATIHVMSRSVDEGPVLAEAAVRLGNRPFLDVLVDKKREGGRQLAQLLRAVDQAGSLPDVSRSISASSGYYSWPSLRAILRYRLARMRARLRSPIPASHVAEHEP